jgi:FMN-dependent NADH-azoreductase
MNLLHIDSSILGEASASRALTAEIVEQLLARNPAARLTYLDLAADPLPHYSAESLLRGNAAEAARDALARGKKVIVAIARGGVYESGAGTEFGESYLQFLLGFLGISDVTFVRAQGLNISPEHREKSLGIARAAIGALDRTPAALAA